jgi:hypothetical protein
VDMEVADERRERLSAERRRVSGEGASSSSLSLHPKPVVRPMPPLNNLPSRCLTRLLGVSLESFGCLLPVELFVSSEASEWLDWRDACDKFEAMERRFGAGGDDGRSFEWGERRPCRSMRWLKRDYEMSSGWDGSEEWKNGTETHGKGVWRSMLESESGASWSSTSTSNS